MASFSVQRNFLHISLNQGQSVVARRGALIAMNDSITMSSGVTNGLLTGLMRKWFTGDTLFRQIFTAAKSQGDLLLAPVNPGDIKVLNIGARQYALADGVFLAAENTVSLSIRSRALAKGFFGGSGFLISETSGAGNLAVNARGGLFEIEVKPGSDMVVDEKHLVAWELSLKQDFRLGSRQSGPVLGRFMGSLTSGEGMVSHFSGSGRLVLSSRCKPQD